MIVQTYLKPALRSVRASQPFNYVATSLVHSLLATAHLQSEAVVKHLHRIGTVERVLPNGRKLRLWSRADDWISNQIYWKGWAGYEPETVPLFFRLASHSTTTIDVGAYIGLFTLLAAHANPQARVYAFEPLPDAYVRLLKNVELNHLSNVACISSAVGATHGQAEFFHVGATLPSSSSLSLDFMRAAPGLRSMLVPVTTLDRYVRDNGLSNVGLVKMDTETTEWEVLSGMEQVLSRDRPVIVCEVLKGRANERRLEQILRPLGYKYYLLTPDGPVSRKTIEGHPSWLNYLFACEDSHEFLSDLDKTAP